MRYLRVQWLNSRPGDPVELYSELDDAGWEVRKLEVFGDGRVGFASPTEATPSTRLGELPVPSVEEINTDPQFRAASIERAEFEQRWMNRQHPAGKSPNSKNARF